jgi:hypothetical protein
MITAKRGMLRALSGAMTKRAHPVQSAYITAKTAFETAERGLANDLVSSGLNAEIDAAVEADDDAALLAISPREDALVAKWKVEGLRRGLWAAETSLLEWSFRIAIKVKPSAKADVELLRERIHLVKPQLIEQALRLPA